jgi:diadenosine tetraphosphate (Ap4A) HIT family hydrolase
MNQNEILKIAAEAGAFWELSETPEKDLAFLMRFAALVAAAERQACAQIAFNAKTYVKAFDAIRARGEK